MNIMDSCPERRNFTLINLVTITFFYADGEIQNGNIAIPFINISLNNTVNALVIYLSILTWFAFRYWLVFKSEPYSNEANASAEKRAKSWKKAFWAAVNEKTIPPNWLNNMEETARLKKRLETSSKKNTQFDVFIHNFKSNVSGNKLYVGYVAPDGGIHREELTGLKKWPFISLVIVKSFLTDPFLPTWYLPWIMFLISITFLVDAGLEAVNVLW